MKKAMKQSHIIFLANLGSVVALIIILAATGITAHQNTAADKANDNRFTLTECATYFINASSYLTSEVRAYAATGNIQNYDNYMTELQETKTREQSIDKMKEIGITPEEDALISEMLSTSNILLPLEEQALKDAKSGKNLEAARMVLSPEYNQALEEISDLKLQFLNEITMRTSNDVDMCVHVARIMESITFFLVLIIALLQVYIYIVMRRKVVKPILTLEKGMSELAAGDLHSDFTMEPDTSEIGMLIHSAKTTKEQITKYIMDTTEKLDKMANKNMNVNFNLDYIGDFKPIEISMKQICTSFNHVLYQLGTTSSSVASGSEQLSDSSQSFAIAAAEQAQSLEQASETMARVTEHIHQTSEKSVMATSLANAAGVALNHSNEQLKGMLEAMNEISNSSGEIGKIVKTIEDIAFQTNILALNAAVEAARAGVAGKGFAVVADEVRNLANKSADASKNTSVMIENSLHTIQSGAQIAQGASDTFVEVMVNAGRAADAMGDITEFSKVQLKEVQEISFSIEQISGTVQNHSSTAEEIAATSVQLANEAVILNDMVQEFNLE